MPTHRESPGTAEGGPGRDGDSRHDRNVALRRDYLATEAAIAEAKAEDNHAAARRFERRLERLKNEFWQLNAGLAIQVARSFTRHGDQNTDDYNQSSALGLWEAFLRWDPNYGTTLGTFSRLSIKGKVHRAVKQTEYGHLSQQEFATRASVVETRERLFRELERQPSNEEIASALGISVESVRRTLKKKDTSFDAPIGDGESTIGDTIVAADESGAEDADWRDSQLALDRLVDDLGELEAWIVVQRNQILHDQPLSLVEIGDQVGIGKEIVRRAERRAEARMAHTRLAMTLGRNPGFDELASAMEGTDVAKLAELLGPNPAEIQGRYRRAVTSRNNALRTNEPALADLATRSMDRIGEEFLDTHMQLVEELARTFTGKESDDGKASSEKLEYATVARELWLSLLAWDPESRTKFPTYARAWFKDRFRRRNRRQTADAMPDWVTGTELWDEVRRAGAHDPGMPRDVLVSPAVLGELARLRSL